MTLLWFACFLCLCSSQKNYFYAIDITIWYTWSWDIAEEASQYELIQYNMIWDSVYTLLNASSDELSTIRDVTLNKVDVVYQSSSEGVNSTQPAQFVMNIEVESRTDSVESYVQYSLSDDVVTALQPLPWTILSVHCTIKSIASSVNKMRGWGIIALVWVTLLVVSVVVYALRKRRKGNKETVFDAHAYINDLGHEKRNNVNPFRNGQYSGYYRQHGRKHNIQVFTLRFGPQSNDINSSITAFTVTGYGCDEFGAYSLEGVYSRKTQRMTLIKAYTTKCKNPRKEIRLEYLLEKQHFIGTWSDEDDEGVIVFQFERSGIIAINAMKTHEMLSPQSDQSRKKSGRRYRSVSNLEIIHEAESSFE